MNSNKKITKVQQRLQNAYKKLKHYRIHKLPSNLRVKEIKKHLLPPMLKQCNYCNKPFLTFRYNAKFCCNNHRDIIHSRKTYKKYKEKANPLEERICRTCGKKFNIRRNRTFQFCSNNCRQNFDRHQNLIHYCKNCNKEIPLYIYKNFCSELCKEKYYLHKPIKKYKLNKCVYKQKKLIFKQQLLIKKCVYCHKEFMTTNIRQQFCSYKCQTKKPTIFYTYNCLNCGKEYTTKYKRKQFCSNDCMIKYSIKNRIRKEYHYKCVICGKEGISKKKETKYCSKLCSSIGFHREKEQKYFKSGEWKEIAKRKIPSLKKEKPWLIKNGIYYHTKKDLQYPTIICKICGRKFKSTSSKIYCNKNCEEKDKIKYVKKICLNCGNEYDCQRQESEWQEFCSEKCMHEYNGITYTCINCGKKFKSSINHSSLYCSYKCKHEFYLKSNIHKEICQQCGKEFYTVNAKFCSYSCSAIFSSNINPNYFHGYFSKFGH